MVEYEHGLQGPPFDDDEDDAYPTPLPSWDDEMADAEAYYEGMMEERRLRRENQ